MIEVVAPRLGAVIVQKAQLVPILTGSDYHYWLVDYVFLGQIAESTNNQGHPGPVIVCLCFLQPKQAIGEMKFPNGVFLANNISGPAGHPERDHVYVQAIKNPPYPREGHTPTHSGLTMNGILRLTPEPIKAS
jgi:hypothetical protein